MDTSGKRRRRWTVEVKRQIVAESFAGDSAVAQLAQKYAVNAKQIFKWREDDREAGLQHSHSINLLPVTVSSEIVVPAANPRHASCQTATGTLRTEFAKEILRFAGGWTWRFLHT